VGVESNQRISPTYIHNTQNKRSSSHCHFTVEEEAGENSGGGNGGICRKSLGRSQAFAFPIADPTTSAHYNPINPNTQPNTPALAVRLTDTSTNGVFVNGTLVGKGKAVVLQVCRGV
jgi:hypothetical protein